VEGRRSTITGCLAAFAAAAAVLSAAPQQTTAPGAAAAAQAPAVPVRTFTAQEMQAMRAALPDGAARDLDAAGGDAERDGDHCGRDGDRHGDHR
jgi:hypothetical protein